MSQHPISTGSPSAGDETTESPQSGRWDAWFSTFVVLLVTALVFVPLFYKGFSNEIGRWRLAAAYEQRLNGELEAAVDSLNAALALDPDHVELYLQRAAWQEQLGNYDAALRDYNRVYELADNDPRMLLGRAMAWHHLGKKEESISDLKLLLANSEGLQRADALNTLAYFRAVNDMDLEEALIDIDKSIDLRGPSPALLDTRGFIRYKLGDLEAARSDLEIAVSAYAQHLAREQRPLEQNNMGIVDLRVYPLQLHAVKQGFAVVVYHRGLIYEGLGETTLAEADFAQVRELGFEPDEKLF